MRHSEQLSEIKPPLVKQKGWWSFQTGQGSRLIKYKIALVSKAANCWYVSRSRDTKKKLKVAQCQPKQTIKPNFLCSGDLVSPQWSHPIGGLAIDALNTATMTTF